MSTFVRDVLTSPASGNGDQESESGEVRIFEKGSDFGPEHFCCGGDDVFLFLLLPCC